MLFASNQSFNCCFFDVDRGVQFENDNSRFRELTKRAFNQYIFRVLFRPPNYFLFFHLFNFKFDGKNIFKIFFSTNDDNSLSVELSRSIRSPQFAFSSLVSPFSDEWWMMIQSPSKVRLREFVYFSAGIAIAGRWHRWRWVDEISHRFTNFAKT